MWNELNYSGQKNGLLKIIPIFAPQKQIFLQ